MKSLYYCFAVILIAISCINCQARTVKIKVQNSLDFDRNGEMVEVRTDKLKVDFAKQSWILKDEAGKEVEYQLIPEESLLIFQASVPANHTSVYRFESGVPSTVKPKTYARQVPERKDDFAWENDFAAYRMYGPALAKEYPSNGVDLWLKCTDSLIVDKFYADELQRGLSYHVNHGLGLDCYSVGHTLGAGGIAPYTSKLWTGDHYSSCKVLVNGPLRSVFVLTYDSLKVENSLYRQTLTITVDAGSMLNKAAVRYEKVADYMKIAAGITLHKTKGAIFSDVAAGIIAYAENAVSDAGKPQGRNYVGVYIPATVERIAEEDNHLLAISGYLQDNDFIYWFGGGWSQWKFSTDEEWFSALKRFAQSGKNPLKVY